MVITTGYDLDLKKFVGTLFGSMMTKLWGTKSWEYECSSELSRLENVLRFIESNQNKASHRHHSGAFPNWNGRAT